MRRSMSHRIPPRSREISSRGCYSPASLSLVSLCARRVRKSLLDISPLATSGLHVVSPSPPVAASSRHGSLPLRVLPGGVGILELVAILLRDDAVLHHRRLSRAQRVVHAHAAAAEGGDDVAERRARVAGLLGVAQRQRDHATV